MMRKFILPVAGVRRPNSVASLGINLACFHIFITLLKSFSLLLNGEWNVMLSCLNKVYDDDDDDDDDVYTNFSITGRDWLTMVLTMFLS